MRCRVNVYGMGTNRGPGGLIASIEDVSEVGWAEYANQPGESYFTLPYNHWANAILRPLQTHIEFQRQKDLSSPWVSIGYNLLSDCDSTAWDTVWYGDDYLSLFGGSDTALKTTYNNQACSAIIQTEALAAIRQSGTTATDPNSRLGFVSVGHIDVTSTTATLMSDYQSRLSLMQQASSMVRGASVPAGVANIGNPDFETGDLTGWTAAAGGASNSVTVVTGGYSGTYRAKLHYVNAPAPTLNDNTHIVCAPGDYINVDCLLSAKTYVQVVWFTAGGVGITSSGDFLTPGANPGRVSNLLGPAPATAAYAIFGVWPPVTGDSYVDDVHAYRMVTATRPIMTVSRTPPFTLDFYGNKGAEKPGIPLEFGEYINNYRLRGNYGSVATQILGIGQRQGGATILYSTQTALPPSQFGIIQKPTFYPLLPDQQTLDKLAYADAQTAAQTNRDLAMVFRNNTLGPYEGYAIGDSLPVTISRGPVSLSGAYYTVWGIQWVGHRDGSESTNLITLPEAAGISSGMVPTVAAASVMPADSTRGTFQNTAPISRSLPPVSPPPTSPIELVGGSGSTIKVA